jgi:predicted DNA-binding transcriptional regulator AlpA
MDNTSMFLYPKQAAKFLGVGTTQFYSFRKLSHFPKSKNPLNKRPLYLRCELEAWAKTIT